MTLAAKATIKFVFERETKNTVRFEEKPEEGKPPIVGSLYLAKWFIGDTKEVTVTIA